MAEKKAICLKLDEETFNKLLVLKQYYSEKMGFNVDLTKTIIMIINDNNSMAKKIT